MYTIAQGLRTYALYYRLTAYRAEAHVSSAHCTCYGRRRVGGTVRRRCVAKRVADALVAKFFKLKHWPMYRAIRLDAISLQL